MEWRYNDYMCSFVGGCTICAACGLLALSLDGLARGDVGVSVGSAKPTAAATRDGASVSPFPTEIPVVRRYKDPISRDVRYRISLLTMAVPDSTCRLNNRGDVLCDDKARHNGHWYHLKIGPGASSYYELKTSGINDHGDVIGTVSRSDSGAYIVQTSKSVFWHNGLMHFVSPSRGDSQGIALNNRGDMLVCSVDQVINNFTYSASVIGSGGNKELGLGAPCCMNDRGAVVVNRGANTIDDASYYGTEHGHVVGDRNATYFVIADGIKYAIDVPHRYCDVINSVAEINNQSELIGELETGIVPAKVEYALPSREAFLWRRGHITVLGSFGGYGSHAGGINNHGAVVGWADIDGPSNQYGGQPTSAFLFEYGRLHDLNHYISVSSHWFLSRAWDINDQGQILCSGNKGLCLLTPYANGGRHPKRTER